MILGIDCSRYGQAQPTGVEKYTDRIVEGVVHKARQLGYDRVRLYVKNASQLQRLLDLVEVADHSLIEVILIDRKKLWTLWGFTRQLLKQKVDVLFVPSHILPLVLPQKSVLTVHGLEALLFPKAYSRFQRWYQWLALLWAKRKKTQLIAVSYAVKEDLQRFFQIPDERITVVYNGFDRGDVLQSKTQHPHANDLVTGDFVLSVGRLEERKNQKRLIQAFELISAEYPKLKLVLVGPDGYGVNEIRERIKNSSVAERIIVPGYQHMGTVRTLLANAQFLAYPSLAEGFGIPLLEAFDVRCPVLTSLGSATQEIAGQAAVFCDPLDVHSIADGMRKILSDPTLQKQLRENGSQRVLEFSWERCVDQTLEVLKHHLSA